MNEFEPSAARLDWPTSMKTWFLGIEPCLGWSHQLLAAVITAVVRGCLRQAVCRSTLTITFLSLKCNVDSPPSLVLSILLLSVCFLFCHGISKLHWLVAMKFCCMNNILVGRCLSLHTVLISPPENDSFQKDLCFCEWCFFIYFATRNLRDAWADRCEILHDGQY